MFSLRLSEIMSWWRNGMRSLQHIYSWTQSNLMKFLRNARCGTWNGHPQILVDSVATPFSVSSTEKRENWFVWVRRRMFVRNISYGE
jgi:hypothetical protein